MKLKGKKPSNSPSIRVAQATYQKTVLMQIVTRTLLALFAVLVLYLCVAALLMRVMPSSAGLILVKNNTYPGGILPVNSQALVNMNPEVVIKTGAMDNLKSAFIPQKNISLVKVIAGPVGEMKFSQGVLTVNGAPLSVPFPVAPEKKYLENEYIGVCISGECTPGVPFIFQENQTRGIPVAQDKPVPAPPVIEAPAGPDRSSPDAVVMGYIVEGYFGNSELACSLTSGEFRSSFGTPEGCTIDAASFTRNLPVEFEGFDKVKLTVKKDAARKKVIGYTIPIEKKRTLNGSFELIKTTEGWTINGHKRG